MTEVLPAALLAALAIMIYSLVFSIFSRFTNGYEESLLFSIGVTYLGTERWGPKINPIGSIYVTALSIVLQNSIKETPIFGIILA